jgi:hypothetical protein
MSPLERRRRRRPTGPIVVIGLAVALALALLVGGILKVRTGSGPYRRDIDRSYAEQGSALIRASNADGSTLTSLMGDMPGLGRTPLRVDLDTLVRSTARTAAAAAALSPPAPSGGLARGFTAVLEDRAEAAADVRAAVDGLLGMTPLPTPDAPPGGSPGADSGRPTLTSGQAAIDIVAVGTLLIRADRAYATVRHQFRRAPGSASLPASVWVTDPQRWAPGPVETLVGQVASSSTLSTVVRVVLLPHTVRITPAAVPPVPGSATGVSLIPPTHAVSISVVVANQGNVTADGIVVSAQVVPRGGGVTRAASSTVDVVAGTSVTVTLPGLPVAPGQTYDLGLALTPPSDQTDRSGITETYVIRIGAAAPAPTTTTTATTAPTKAESPAKAPTGGPAKTPVSTGPAGAS